MNIERVFEQAKWVAAKRNDARQHRLGAIGIRSDGATVEAYNGSTMNAAVPAAHAEARLVRKLDVGSIVFVARINKMGITCLAKPCRSCETRMRSRGVKKVYYTISENEYGVMIFNKRKGR